MEKKFQGKSVKDEEKKLDILFMIACVFMMLGALSPAAVIFHFGRKVIGWMSQPKLKVKDEDEKENYENLVKKIQEQKEQLDELLSAKLIAEETIEQMQQEIEVLGSTQADCAVVETDMFRDELERKRKMKWAFFF